MFCLKYLEYRIDALKDANQVIKTIAFLFLLAFKKSSKILLNSFKDIANQYYKLKFALVHIKTTADKRP